MDIIQWKVKKHYDICSAYPWKTKILANKILFFFFFFRGNFPGIKFSVEHVEANLFLVCSDPILEAQYTK